MEVHAEDNISFRDLVHSERLLSALERLGFSTPTPVQRAALPLASVGKDLIIQAKTGSGKTIAFALPMLELLEKNARHPGNQALVLTPTRELANQICEVIVSIFPDVAPVCAIGGISIHQQKERLARDRRIVVGTPGRILDLLRQRELVLRTTRFFVVDEVDEMFSMNFIEDVRTILSRLPNQRQGLFVSATVTPQVEIFAKSFLTDPEKVMIDSPGEELPQISHKFYQITGDLTAKVVALCDLIEVLHPRSAIVFCNTKSDTELVEVYLRRRGFDARLLNSDLTQRERDSIVALIKAGKLRFLIGTDIAARGLDIEHIDLVVNYSLPEQYEAYLHRTGRTGRGGRSGVAISLIGPHDFRAFIDIKRNVAVEFIEHTLPTDSEVFEARLKHLLSVIERVTLVDGAKELALASRLLEQLGNISNPNENLVALVAKLCTVLLEHQALLVEHEAAQFAHVKRSEASGGKGGGSSHHSRGGGGRPRDRGRGGGRRRGRR